jgi:multiple sugar transport system permease protein
MQFTKRKNAITVTLLFIFLGIMLFPFYVMIMGAFKPHIALTLVPPDINPFTGIVTANLKYVIQRSDIGLWFINSMVIGLGVAAGVVCIASTAGYAFAKIRFPGGKALFTLIIATMILPKQIMLIPNYLVAMNLHLTNSRLGIILTTITPPFGIFLCRQFMMGIPTELTQAAEIDGCSEPAKFFYIILPLALPAMGALALFSFFAAYNDYLWQLIMIRDRSLQTVPVGISFFAERMTFNFSYQLMAAALCTVPLVILFLLFQRVFIQGVTLGGVKG